MNGVSEGNQMQTKEELTNFDSNALKSCRHLCVYVVVVSRSDGEEIRWILNWFTVGCCFASMVFWVFTSMSFRTLIPSIKMIIHKHHGQKKIYIKNKSEEKEKNHNLTVIYKKKELTWRWIDIFVVKEKSIPLPVSPRCFLMVIYVFQIWWKIPCHFSNGHQKIKRCTDVVKQDFEKIWKKISNLMIFPALLNPLMNRQ